MTDINLTFTLEETNALLNVLNKDDALFRAAIIQKIREQGAPQVPAEEAGTEETVATS